MNMKSVVRRRSRLLSDGGFLRVAFSIVDPLGGSQSFIVWAPVEEAGVDVQRVQQVGGGSDHPEAQQQH